MIGRLHAVCGVLLVAACQTKEHSTAAQVEPPGPSSKAHDAAQAPAKSASSALRSMSFGMNHGCVVTREGSVKCWGANDTKKLGAESGEQSRVPVQVKALERGVQTVHVSTFFNCALNDGGVWCWGGNWLGQLGRGDAKIKDAAVPAPVVGLGSGVKMLSLAANTACALLDSGAVKCWGENEAGQLGDGTERNRFAPVQVLGLDAEVKEVATGGTQTCALSIHGKVSCWGARYLSDGMRPKYTSKPLPVVGLSEAVGQVVSGSDFACALGQSGKVYCWGWSTLGGSGASAEPVLVAGIGPGVVRISAAGNGACAQTKGGDVWCWGIQAPGATASEKPRMISGLNGLTQFALGATLGGALVGERLFVWPAALVPEQSAKTLGVEAVAL